MRFIIGDKVQIKDSVPFLGGSRGEVREVREDIDSVLVFLDGRLTYFSRDRVEWLGTTEMAVRRSMRDKGKRNRELLGNLTIMLVTAIAFHNIFNNDKLSMINELERVAYLLFQSDIEPGTKEFFNSMDRGAF